MTPSIWERIAAALVYALIPLMIWAELRVFS